MHSLFMSESVYLVISSSKEGRTNFYEDMLTLAGKGRFLRAVTCVTISESYLLLSASFILH